MIRNQITDSATKESAKVRDGGLVVTQFTCPPMLPQKNKVFRQYFTDDGTATGDEDMLVDGSGTAVEFWVPASSDNDRYITYINFVIADEGAKLKLFGAIAALTNGCQLFYQRDNEDVHIDDELKTNWDFMRMSLNQSPIAEIKPQKDVEGKVDAYTPCVDFTKFLPPHGLKLDKGSSQRLVIKIQDDVDGIDAFNAVAYGFERFE